MKCLWQMDLIIADKITRIVSSEGLQDQCDSPRVFAVTCHLIELAEIPGTFGEIEPSTIPRPGAKEKPIPCLIFPVRILHLDTERVYQP